jgi:CBS domain containing-hemolysin-like protein
LFHIQHYVALILELLFFTVFALDKYKFRSSTGSLNKNQSQASRNQLRKQSDEMSSKLAILIVFVMAVLNWATETAGQQSLEAKLAGARLPTSLSQSSAVYDGVDDVYIFGG